MRLTRMLTLGALALAYVGCAKPPLAAVDAARASLDAAVKAEAPVYAADSFTKAAGLVKTMDADISVQAKRSSLSRSYKNVVALAKQAADAARQAADAAVKGKELVKADVARMAPEVEKGLNDAEARIREIAAVRGIKLDINQLKGQLEAGKKNFEEAADDAAAAKLMDARNKLQATSELLAAAARAVDEAIKGRGALPGSR